MTKPFESQIGGEHYLDFEIQPAEFIQRNGLNFLEGNVIKRMCRHSECKGLEDLEKAIDEIKKIAFVEYGVDLNNKFLTKSMDEMIVDRLKEDEVKVEPLDPKDKAMVGFDKDGDFFVKINDKPQAKEFMHKETVKKNKEFENIHEVVYTDRIDLNEKKLDYDPVTIEKAMNEMNPKRCKNCEN